MRSAAKRVLVAELVQSIPGKLFGAGICSPARATALAIAHEGCARIEWSLSPRERFQASSPAHA